MQTEFLREFVVFSRYMNFSRAAAYLNIAQPTLSSHIASMEKELGFELVSRGKRLKLTTAGKQFCSDCESLLEAYDESVRACRSMAKRSSSGLVFERPIHIGGYDIDFNRFIAFLMKRAPELNVELRTSTSNSARNLIESREIDVVMLINERLIDYEPGIREKVETVSLPIKGPHDFYLWVDKSSPLAERDEIDLGTIKSKHLIPSSLRYKVLEDFANLANDIIGSDNIEISHWPGSLNDSLNHIKPDECSIVPGQDRSNPIFSANEDRVFRKLVGLEKVVKPCLVFLKENTNPAIEVMLQALDEYATEVEEENRAEAIEHW